MKTFVTSKQVLNAATVATTGNSGTSGFDMPIGPAYMFVMDIAAGTGTSPTADVAIQISPDDGTTWWTVSRWAQVTTAAVVSYKMVRNGLAVGEVGFVQAIADTGGAVDKDFLMTRKARILYTIGGTNPAFATLKVWLLTQQEGG